MTIVFATLAILSILTTARVALGASCFCGEAGACRFSASNVPLYEDCSTCSNFTKFIYRRDCRTLNDNCMSNPCKHGGNCVRTLGSYYCACPLHYYGVDCSIFKPKEALMRLVVPVVYFPMNLPPNDLRLIHVGVKDFGDQFNAVIVFNDHDTRYEVDEYSFERGNMRQICLRSTRKYPRYSDRNICDVIPNEEVNVFTFPHHPVKVVTSDKWVTVSTNATNMEIVGNMEKVSVTLFNGNYTAYSRTYFLFVPFRPVDRICHQSINFVGCSKLRDEAIVFQQRESIVIGAIAATDQTKVCWPYLEVSQKWYRLKYALLKEIPEEKTKQVKFKENTLTSGIHEFHFEYAIIADPPHYGSNQVILNYGICWIRVIQGELTISIEGGDEQSYPCGKSFRLKALNLNENFRMVDMNFTWVCSNNRDPRCSEIHSQGSVFYRESQEGCGSIYTFTVFVNHPTEDKNATAQTKIKFDPKLRSQIKITCEKNCMPHIRVNQTATVAVHTVPFIPGKVSFDVKMTGNEAPMKQIQLRETNNDPIIVFPPHVLQFNATNLTLTVHKFGVSARFEMSLRIHPNPPKCTFMQDESMLMYVECNVKKKEDYGIYYLFEHSDTDQFKDEVTVSSTGNFSQIRLYNSRIAVVYINFYGDASQADYEVPIPYVDPIKALMKLQLASSLRKEGNHLALLRTASVASRLIMNISAMLPPEELVVDEDLAESSIQIASALLKVEFFKTEEMTDTAFNCLWRALTLRTQLPVKASHLRWYGTEVMKKLMNEVRDMVYKGIVHIFRQDNLGKNTCFLGTIVQLLTFKDPFIETHGRSGISERHQFYKRLNEHSSVSLLNTLDSLSYVDQAGMSYMNDPVWYTVDVPHTIHFGLIGTMHFISKSYSKFQHKVMNIKEYTFLGQDNVTQNPLLFQVYLFNEDIFWWHRYIEIQSVVIRATLEDYTTKNPLPPSKTQFTVNIKLLDRAKILLNSTALRGRTRNPTELIDQKERYSVIFSFVPPDGVSTMTYMFSRCTAYHGCRVTFTYNRIPSIDDYDLESDETSGAITIDEYIAKGAKYYVGVLPGIKEEPNHEVKFTLHVQVAACLTWEDYRYVGNCDLDELITMNDTDDTDDTNATYAVCKCRHMSWFAVTLPKVRFKRVFHSKMNVKAVISFEWLILFVSLLLMVLFLLAYLWCRFMDKSDTRKRYLRIMETSSPIHEWEYIIGVFSNPTFSTTTSKVGLRLVGTTTCSSVGLVTFGMPKMTVAVEDEWYSMGSNQKVGRLDEIQIWHDHSGCSPSWNCEKILIYDVQQNDLNCFTISKVFKVNESNDYTLMTHEPSYKIKTMNEIIETGSRYFWKNFRLELANKHRAFSFYFKSPRNVKTRVECLSIYAVFVSTLLCASLLYWSGFSSLVDFYTETYTIRTILQISVLSLIAAHVFTSIVSEMLWATKGNRMRSSTNYSRSISRSRSSTKHSGKSLQSQRDDSLKKKSTGSSNRSVFGPKQLGVGEQFRHLFRGDGAVRRSSKKSRANQKLLSIIDHTSRRIIRYLARVVHPVFYCKVTHDKSTPLSPSKSLKIFTRITWILTIVVIVLNFLIVVILGCKMPWHWAQHWFQWAGIILLVDAFLLDPMKIAFFTWILLSVLKKSNIEMNPVQFDSSQKILQTEQCDNYRDFIAKKSRSYYKPMTMTRIEGKRKWRKRRKWIIFLVLSVIALVGVLVLTSIIAKMGVKTSYLSMNYIKVHLNWKNPPIKDVSSKRKLHRFMINNFIASINKLEWYNSRFLWSKTALKAKERRFERKMYATVKGSAFQHDMFLLGPFRIKQHRVLESTEPVLAFKKWYNQSYQDIWFSLVSGWINLDRNAYCEGWEPFYNCLPRMRQWNYTQQNLNWERGLNSWYPSGGYKRTIEWSPALAIMQYTNLALDSWIDNRTRVVLVDFNVFNINLNLLIVGVITVETLSSGVCSHRVSLQAVHPPAWSDFPRGPVAEIRFTDYKADANGWIYATNAIAFLPTLLVLAYVFCLKWFFLFCYQLSCMILPAWRISIKFFLLCIYLSIFSSEYFIESSSFQLLYHHPVSALLRETVPFEKTNVFNFPALTLTTVIFFSVVTGFIISYFIHVCQKGERKKRKRRKRANGFGITYSDVILDHIVEFELQKKRLRAINAKFTLSL